MDTDKMKEKAEKLIAELKKLISEIREVETGPETIEKQKQLQAIDKTIQQMQKAKIAIPDEMRHLKSKLIGELAESDEAGKLLLSIITEVNELFSDLAYPLNKNKNKRIRKKGRTIDRAKLRNAIISALKHYGGSAASADVLNWMEANLKGQFTVVDLSCRECGQIVWQNNTSWERYKMIKAGILKSDSPHGTWELNEDYK